MKHKTKLIDGGPWAHVITYEYRGVTITGTSDASSSSPYIRTRKWVAGNGLRASSLADAKRRIDHFLDHPLA